MKIAVNGINGRMGQEIVSVINSEDGLIVVDFNGLDENTCADVVIDFSSPDGCMQALQWCEKNNVPLVVGTTGLSDFQKETLEIASENIPIVFAPNMSLSVNVMFAISKLVAKYLPDAEVEIIEAHHRYKKDAPSGTAIGIGEAIAIGRDQDFKEVVKFTRERHSENIRDKNEIGFSVVRGGDIVGQHTAMFILNGEELNISSMINNRKSFASGAVLAAKFLVKQTENELFSMQDVLGIDI